MPGIMHNAGMKTKLMIGAVCAAVCSGATFAMDGPSENAAFVHSIYTQQLASAAGSSSLFVRPGVLAGKNLKKVTFWAEATGVSPGEPVEFYVISPKSGHAYEALAVSFAKPGDIHAALEFIGMKPGATVDYDRLRLWPKGERVFMTFQWDEGTNGAVRKAAEQLLVDADTGTTLPVKGFCFTGSTVRNGIYDADENEPGSIASDYNEPGTVLDVPFKRDKSGVYRRFTANPDIQIPKGKLVQVELEPEYRDGTLRTADMILSVSVPEGAASWKELKCSTETGGEKSVSTPEALMDALQKTIEQGKTPYLNLQFAADVPLGWVVEMCRFLDLLCTDNGIRIEPPAENQLFYKAFLPQPEFRRRADRPSQPWEIHLGAASGLKLVQINEIWPDEAPKPELTIEEHTAKDPEEALAILRDKGIGMPVLVIFAPESMPYGKIAGITAPLRKEFPTLYIFPGRPE